MSFNIFEVFVRSSDDIAVEKVKEFIEKNPTKLNEIFAYSGSEGTLLHFSCFWKNHPKVVSYLLSKNADVTKCFYDEKFDLFDEKKSLDFDGLTAKQIAEKKGFGNIVTLFEKYEREQASREKLNKISNPILGEVEEKPVPVVKPSPNPQPKPVIVVKPSPNPQPVEEKPDPALQPIPQPEPVPVVKSSPNPQPESDVEAHLKALGYDQYIESFYKFGAKSIDDILLFEEEDWKNLNVMPFHKKKILASIPKEGITIDTTTSIHQNQGNAEVTSIPETDKIPLFDNIATRVTDVSNEPSQKSNPIIGLFDIPLCSFDETLQSLETCVPGIENFSFTCTMFAKNIDNNKKQNLTDDEISSINLYTCESNPKKNSIYFVLNKALRDQDREALKPFFPYLHLLLHSMSKLPKCAPGTNLWRGVQTNVSSNYERGMNIIWWGLSSCTKDMKTLDTFLDKNTDRTIFIIQINSAVEITQFSAHPKEEEVLVFPCVTFEVQNVHSPSKGLWIVQLKEIYPPGKVITGFDQNLGI